MLARVAALEGGPSALRPSLAAVRADDDPDHVALHAVVLDLFERVDRLVAGDHRALWQRLLALLQTRPRRPGGGPGGRRLQQPRGRRGARGPGGPPGDRGAGPP
ncbi:hypothetical protein [Nocardioides sp. TF02-7]|uniref:hypothetical protein n=1 Tax=Nocardioides sp. TF02-7 TaxID=2917724 RepID=UPI001F05B297|nr:hypothetical protein [Nocardioides sp. TF02-7]UMG94522.1 hypothetical protein MF408_11455 [Nocardioides sp. TF02-7]